MTFEDETDWQNFASLVNKRKSGKPKRPPKARAINADRVILHATNTHEGQTKYHMPLTEVNLEKVGRKTKSKIRKGRINIDAKLDLHGFTKKEARDKFCNFVIRSYEERCKFLLVVTGKGEGGQGILKNHLPEWVTIPDIARLVLSLSHADEIHGGNGAFYLILRTKR